MLAARRVQVLSLQRVLESREARSRLAPEDLHDLRTSLQDRRAIFATGLPVDRWIPDADADVCQCCQARPGRWR
jgi:hypothetical protein